MSKTPGVVAARSLENSGGGQPRRCKFIVYEGPSQLGKTERALHWFGNSNTLLVQTQGITSPNLREFVKGTFSAILYDEGNWELVYQNKALFQASPRPVMLSQSQCNESAYSVMVWQVPMMICSNNFWENCSNNEARDWIMQNCYFIPCLEKMYE